jgi:predicted alpha/beta superfamily hydrolase
LAITVFAIVLSAFIDGCASQRSLKRNPSNRAEEQNFGKGTIQLIGDIEMPQLKRQRKVWVYLPAEYNTSAQRYPVLYMHDGQNLFYDELSFVGAWKVQEALDELYTEKKNKGVIVVAIENGKEHRWDEYSPWKNSGEYNIGWGEAGKGGEGQQYAEFIVNTLKPYIDKNFRTLPERENTGIAGSSMGGLISIYIGLRYNDVFSKIAAFSPAFWFAKPAVMEQIKNLQRIPNTRIYIDVGQSEGPETVTEAYVKYTTEAYQLLTSRLDKPEENLKLFIDPDGIHKESAWKRRFPGAFFWLFSERSAQ